MDTPNYNQEYDYYTSSPDLRSGSPVAPNLSPRYGDGWGQGPPKYSGVGELEVGGGAKRQANNTSGYAQGFQFGSPLNVSSLFPGVPNLMPQFPDVVVSPVAEQVINLVNNTTTVAAGDAPPAEYSCMDLIIENSDPGDPAVVCSPTISSSNVIDICNGGTDYYVMNLQVSGSVVKYDKLDVFKFWITKAKVGNLNFFRGHIYAHKTPNQTLLTIGNCPSN